MDKKFSEEKRNAFVRLNLLFLGENIKNFIQNSIKQLQKL